MTTSHTAGQKTIGAIAGMTSRIGAMILGLALSLVSTSALADAQSDCDRGDARACERLAKSFAPKSDDDFENPPKTDEHPYYMALIKGCLAGSSKSCSTMAELYSGCAGGDSWCEPAHVAMGGRAFQMVNDKMCQMGDCSYKYFGDKDVVSGFENLVNLYIKSPKEGNAFAFMIMKGEAIFHQRPVDELRPGRFSADEVRRLKSAAKKALKLLCSKDYPNICKGIFIVTWG